MHIGTSIVLGIEKEAFLGGRFFFLIKGVFILAES